MLDKYLDNMSEVSKKFPAVMTTIETLGLEEGTILRFDWASGKYVSISEEEDIADDYYYSGYAVALDPYLVRDHIGGCFTYIEQDQIEDAKPEQVIEHVVTKEDVALNPGEDLKEGETVGLPMDEPLEKTEEVNTLVVDCKCGHRNVVGSVNGPGINITLMAADENSFVELHCPECGSSLKLCFDQSQNIRNDEPIKEESN